MIADHPWFGCGPGNFKSYYTRYKVPEASETIADPHNFLLEIAATAGVPALTLFLLIFVALVTTLSGRRTDAAGQGASRTGPGWQQTAAPMCRFPDGDLRRGRGGICVGVSRRLGRWTRRRTWPCCGWHVRPPQARCGCCMPGCCAAACRGGRWSWRASRCW